MTVKYWMVIGVPAMGEWEHKVCRTENEAQLAASAFEQNNYKVTIFPVSEEEISGIQEGESR